MRASPARHYALLAAIGGVIAGCREPESRGTSQYPVEWSSSLELDSLSHIEARLTRSFEDTVDVFRYANREDRLAQRNGERAAITDCTSYLRLTDSGFAPKGDMLVRGLQRIGAVCRAVAALQAAAPSRESFVRDLAFDTRMAGLLPPGLAVIVSGDDSARVQAAEAAGRSLVELEPDVVGTDSASALVVTGKSWRAEVTMMGRGDFDGDEVEDLLVMVVGSMTAGTYQSTRLFVLGRKTADSRLAVVRTFP